MRDYLAGDASVGALIPRPESTTGGNSASILTSDTRRLFENFVCSYSTEKRRCAPSIFALCPTKFLFETRKATKHEAAKKYISAVQAFFVLQKKKKRNARTDLSRTKNHHDIKMTL